MFVVAAVACVVAGGVVDVVLGVRVRRERPRANSRCSDLLTGVSGSSRTYGGEWNARCRPGNWS